MKCPECEQLVSHTMDGSAWGGPFTGNGDRAARTFYPCGCVVELDPIPWVDIPKRRTPDGGRGRA